MILKYVTSVNSRKSFTFFCLTETMIVLAIFLNFRVMAHNTSIYHIIFLKISNW
jgi:hypothetical protein